MSYSTLLPEFFAPFDKAKTGYALLQMIALVERLGKETAEQWRYHYPITNAARVHDWIVMALMKL